MEIVFEREVQGLCGEISDDIGHVASPKGSKSVVFDCSAETVDDTCEWFFDFFVGMLCLEEQFDSFDGSGGGFGYGSGDASTEEVTEEVVGGVRVWS